MKRTQSSFTESFFPILPEAISLFTIDINILLDIPWYLIFQKGFPDAVYEEKYNTVSGMHTS